MVFTVIDIETTGLSRHYHKITEIAAARLKDGKIVREYHTLINPKVRIPTFITKLTGIDNKLVKDAPTITEILPSFVKFLGTDVFVAHNATFDYRFLEHNLKKHFKYSLENPRLCTRKLAYRLFPDLSRRRLSDLCTLLNIKNSQAHRAMADVHATIEVFSNMLSLLNDKGISKVEDIFKFEKSKAKE